MVLENVTFFLNLVKANFRDIIKHLFGPIFSAPFHLTTTFSSVQFIGIDRYAVDSRTRFFEPVHFFSCDIF